MLKKSVTILFGLLLFGLFAYLYKDVIFNLVHIWSNDGNYSHGFFVPVIVGYIIWSKRNELPATPLKPFWPAILLVLISGILLIAGQLSIHRFTKHFSLLLMIFSLTLLVFGRGWTRKLMLPLAFFIFMFPLPQFIKTEITGPLQIFSSYISVNILSMMNYPVHREGNIIYLPDIVLSVAEACSSLRFLVALTFLAAVAGYFVLKSNWKRLILLFCAFPIAIILNWTRITGTVLLANHWGKEAALGFFHNFSGLIIFGIATILISFIMFFLRRKEKQTAPAQTSDVATVSAGISIKPAVLIASSGFLALLILYGNFLFSLKPGPVDLQALPLKIGHYKGKEIPIDPAITDSSAVTQDRSITFYHQDGPPVNVYLGYYRTGRELKDFAHSPDACLPATGWKIIKKEELPLNLSGYEDDRVEVLKYVSTQMGVTQVMITWLQSGNLVVGNSGRKMQAKIAVDTILNFQYNDITKVMIQTIIAPGETEEAATRRLIRFINLFYPGFLASLDG